jgi:flagellar hook-associated protein 1 FlgK
VTHNLSNIDTTGYTRQQVVQADRTYLNVGESYISKSQTGLGVSYAQVRQVRDYFLDRTYRVENGRAAYYEEGYQAAVELDTLFGEMEGVAFQSALSDLWIAAEELQKDPANSTNQGLFVSTCATFLEEAQAVYNGLASYQDILNEKVKDTVDIINDYGNKVLELNGKIKAVETGGQEKANDLRDARNQLTSYLVNLLPTKLLWNFLLHEQNIW